MKLAGREIKGANVETIVLPRGDGEPIVLRAMAILDETPFTKLCPTPRPPAVIKRGGERSFNVEDPRFVEALADYGQKRGAWMVLTSLRLGTPDLEWSTVDYGDPNTWAGYVDELRDAGFAETEIVRIVRACMVANALDDAKLEEARKSFLATQGRQDARLSSLQDEQSDTPSGVPVSAGVSDHQD